MPRNPRQMDLEETPEEQTDESAEDSDELEDAEDTDDIALLRQKLDEGDKEREQLRAIAQRAQADLVNYRRRVTEEIEELKQTANAGLLLKMLMVADNLDRAIEFIPEESAGEGWVEGVKLLHKNLETVLESENVTRIDAVGELFEPWEHEAVSEEEALIGLEGTILRVVREGYRLNGKVLRPAQVVVGKAPTEESKPQEEEPEPEPESGPESSPETEPEGQEEPDTSA